MICGWPGWVLRLRCSLATWVPTSEGLPQPPTVRADPLQTLIRCPTKEAAAFGSRTTVWGPISKGCGSTEASAFPIATSVIPGISRSANRRRSPTAAQPEPIRLDSRPVVSSDLTVTAYPALVARR